MEQVETRRKEGKDKRIWKEREGGHRVLVGGTLTSDQLGKQGIRGQGTVGSLKGACVGTSALPRMRSEPTDC